MANSSTKNNNYYSDGDYIENSLLEIFSIQNEKEKRAEIKKRLRSGNWPFIYHLHEDRENILNWYKFKKNTKLLEIGAGCGAVTGLFLRSVKDVYTIDISKRRLDILKARFREFNNLHTKVANIMMYNPKTKFDYVTSIGVLEYSGRFVNTKTPYLDFLKKVKTLLSPNGIFILTIENKLGLKYWAGSPEDHTGRVFDSIEGYPNYEGVRTFSKKELSILLRNAGFSNISFYYPYPDYKFPREIYSDSFLPNKEINPSFDAIYPIFYDKSIYKYDMFNQSFVFLQLLNEGIIDIFANSFLIFMN